LEPDRPPRPGSPGPSTLGVVTAASVFPALEALLPRVSKPVQYVGGDLKAQMREHGVPAFTVDGHRPLGAFDLLGVSFSTELGYTNLLTSLDLAGIPLHAVDRTEQHPI